MTLAITLERIAELERLEAAATPGIWSTRASQDGSGDVGIKAPGARNVLAECFAAMRDASERAVAEASANAAFIATARNEMRPLLASLREAETQRDAAIARAEKAERRDKNARELLRLEREITGSFTIENVALRARAEKAERKVAELRERIFRMTPPKRCDDGTCIEHPMDGAIFCASCGGPKEHCRRAAKAVAPNGEGRDAG